VLDIQGGLIVSLPPVKELEANVQRLIEERLPDENWKRAHGRVDSPDDGGFEGYWYDTKNPSLRWGHQLYLQL
jgi:hypothetical protein